ncbi:MAG: LLM class flavin-dependent oxidoreductase [Phototrophicales bacterium]|nr:LLM class flavin-dependent oxidoreductase [Phototrophicales bacterium]
MLGRMALYLQDVHPLKEAIAYVQYAEMRGFEAVWQAESGLARDAIVPMAAYATSTSKIRIGSAVINNWSRNPATIASTFLTLDDLAPSRIMCGIGIWYDPLASQMGIRRERPLLALRETIHVIRGLLAMKKVTFQGEFVHMTDVELNIVHGRKEPRYVPIYIGATGSNLLALAGEIADGVLLNFMVSPQYNHFAMTELARGARQISRSVHSIDRPQLIACSVDNNRQKALDVARLWVTRYLAQHPALMRASGIPQELIDMVTQVVRYPLTDTTLAEAGRLVPDDIVQMVTASGTRDECREKIRQYFESGATCAVLCPLGNDVRLLIDTFADDF